MVRHADRRDARRSPTPFVREPGHTLGDEALEFTSWFAKSKYHLMGGFLGELAMPAKDLETLRDRYCRALTHALRVQRARSVVTFLLALGVVATAATSIANLLDVPAPLGLLERAAAISASVAVALIVLRLLFDRYLERCDVTLTFLAIQLGVAAGRRTA